ncbi:uncharacterized protein LOC144644272 [Oculina patagonica]
MESETSLGSPGERSWSFPSVSELSALSTTGCQSQVTLGGSEMESETSIGSPGERSWSFPSVSELSALSTTGCQSQVTLGGSEMESETSIGSPGERSWSFPSVSELSALSTMGFQSQVTLGGIEMESGTSLGSLRGRSWSFSSVSELSALSTIEFQSGPLQGSQVSLDLSAAEFESHPALLSPIRTYDRSLSYSEPSINTTEWRRSQGSHVSFDMTGMTFESLSAPPTPKRRTSAKEWRYRRDSHVSLDMTGMTSESLSAPPTPKRRTSAKERRYRGGSHVSLDFSQMEPELSLSPQASKERCESPLSPASTSTVPLESSITDLQVSLDLSCVEAPQSPKQGSEGSLSEREAALDYRTTLPTSAESTEGRLSPSSSEDSFRSSKEDFDIEGDDTFASCTVSLSSLQSNRSQDFHSIPSMELGTLQESTSSLYHSADEESTRKSLRSSKPETLKPDSPPKKTSTSSIVGISHVSLDLAAEECEPQSISQSSKQRYESSTKDESSSLATGSESISGIAESSPISLHQPGMESENTPQCLKQRSASSLCESVFKAFPPPNESGDNEDYRIETSDHKREGLLTKVIRSSDSSKDVDLTREDASFTSCAGSWSSLYSSRSQDFLDTLQERTGHDVTDSNDEFYSADEEEQRKGIRSLKRDTLKPETRDQSQVQTFASFGSTDEVPHETVFLPIVIEDAKKVTPEGGKQQQGQLPIQNLDQSVSLPAMHMDLEKSHSPSSKLGQMKSKTPQIPQKVKKAFKFLKPEKERKRYSKFQQECLSDDSDDVTERPSTARKRFLFFGRKKKRSLSRGETSRQDSSSQTDPIWSALPISSTHQENAPVVTAQTLPSDQGSPSGGVHSSQETGTDTLTEGSIDLGNNNDDSLHHKISGLSKSNESGNSTTGESMDIEQFEHKDGIDLSKGSFECSNVVTDDSHRPQPETSCESEDIRNIEADLTEQGLGSQSVSRQSISDKGGLVEGVSLGWSPGQDKSTSSTTPSLNPEAKPLRCLSSVSSTLSTSSSEGSIGSLGSFHKKCQRPSASERLSSQSKGDLELNDGITLKSEADLTEQILALESDSRQSIDEEKGLVEAISLGLSPGQHKSTSSTTPSLNQEAKRCLRRLSSVSSTLSTSSSEGSIGSSVRSTGSSTHAATASVP